MDGFVWQACDFENRFSTLKSYFDTDFDVYGVEGGGGS